MFVDSHCHLHLIDYDKLHLTEAEVVENAAKNNVEHMLCVGTHFNQLPTLKDINQRYPNVSISAGFHPNEVVANSTEVSVDNILKLIENADLKAIGETGLDYYHKTCPEDVQKQKFVAQIHAAKIAKLPLIIHVRESKEDAIKILADEKADTIGGVIHCFTDDIDTAKRYLDLGFYISYPGVITFSKATQLHETVKHLPLDRVLIETDAPYLAPQAKRGKINLPSYLPYVAEEIAKLKDISIEEVAKRTSKNYFDLFGEV